jgi:carboxyl-terminal processing protease
MEQNYPDAPDYQGPPTEPPKRKMSRRRMIVIGVVLGLVVICVLVAAGVLVDRLVFSQKKTAKEFRLAGSESYQEALFDIRQYFYRDYSNEKIQDAAQKAVDSEKKKGVTSYSKFENAGLSALVAALKDPHSEYLTESEANLLNEDISGSFFGIGTMLREDNKLKRPKVFSVVKGSPAERAGVKQGDIILAVDGKDTKGKSTDVVVTWIRGQGGTQVELKVSRPGVKKELTFKITREKIQIPELETELIDGHIGSLKVMNFSEGIGQKVRAAVRDLKQKGAQGFILDIRNNPGGLLSEAVILASVFINDGSIVSYQTKGHDRVSETAKGGAETDQPLVVLVNGASASSSEIVAGALKDRGRATLVGTKTYGKGSIQKLYQLDNKGDAKLTVSLYYLPNGESIDGKGVAPDVVVEFKDNLEKEDTLQLDKAKQVLDGLIQKHTAGGALHPAA